MKDERPKRFAPFDPELFKLVDTISYNERRELMKRVIAKTKARTESIIEEAIRRGIITRQEYDLLYRSMYLDEYGMDSFAQYIEILIHKQEREEAGEKVDDDLAFLTLNKGMLHDKAKLEKRFGIAILSPEDIEKEVKRQEKKNKKKK
jgi:hypothetical protein